MLCAEGKERRGSEIRLKDRRDKDDRLKALHEAERKGEEEEEDGEEEVEMLLEGWKENKGRKRERRDSGCCVDERTRWSEGLRHGRRMKRKGTRETGRKGRKKDEQEGVEMQCEGRKGRVRLEDKEEG